MRILFLDDDPLRAELFFEMAKAKAPSAAIYWVKTAQKAIECLKGRAFDHVYLDHDLADFHYTIPARKIREGTGMDVVRYLVGLEDEERERLFHTLFVVHSWNPDGGRLMTQALQDGGFSVVRKEFGPEVIQ